MCRHRELQSMLSGMSHSHTQTPVHVSYRPHSLIFHSETCMSIVILPPPAKHVYGCILHNILVWKYVNCVHTVTVVRCVCVCVCMYSVCVGIYNVYMSVYMSMWPVCIICVHVHACTYCVCMCMSMVECSVWICVCVCVCVCVCMCVCVCVCVYV